MASLWVSMQGRLFHFAAVLRIQGLIVLRFPPLFSSGPQFLLDGGKGVLHTDQKSNFQGSH